MTPIEGVEIQLTDAMTYGDYATTDLYGQASLMVDYPYGTVLEVVGTHVTTGFLFDGDSDRDRDTAGQSGPDRPDRPGHRGPFCPESAQHSHCGERHTGCGRPCQCAGHRFRRVRHAAFSKSRPTAAGEITAWILKDGYDLYSEVFPIATEPSAHGTVTLSGEGDHSGVLVTAEPGGYATVTAVDGTWHLMNLEPGTYQITAAKEGWSSGYADITVADGDHVTGLDFDAVAGLRGQRLPAGRIWPFRILPAARLPRSRPASKAGPSTGSGSTWTSPTTGSATWKSTLTSPGGTSCCCTIVRRSFRGSSSAGSRWFDPGRDLAAFIGKTSSATGP